MFFLTIFKYYRETTGRFGLIIWYGACVLFFLIISSLVGVKKYQSIVVAVIGTIGIISTAINLNTTEDVLIVFNLIDISILSLMSIAGGIISIFILKINKDIVNIAETESEMNKSRFNKLIGLVETSNEGMQIGEKLLSSSDSSLEIINSINSEMDNIKEDIMKMDENVEEYKDNTEKIVSFTKNVKNIISEQTSLISETSASIEEMTSSINNITEISSSKKETIDKLLKTTLEGEREMNKSLDAINEVAESSTKILDVIKIIVGVSNQTNLLAMNASIEAAHAGEAGAGFGVVADEIRKLAEDTNHNTKLITDTLKKNINDINIASEINQKASESFHKINDEVKEVVYAMEEIIMGMTQMSAGTKEVMNAVSNLLDKSEDTNSSTRNMEQIILKNKDELETIAKSSKKNKQKLENIVINFNRILEETEKISNIGKENIRHIKYFDDELSNVN
jgi:methyl-accepting chemotaxis protein